MRGRPATPAACPFTPACPPAPPARAQALDPLHVWAGGFLEARLKWRRSQPITLLELRAYELRPPVMLPSSEDVFGCFSWVGLPGVPEAEVEGALAARVPALGDAAFAEKQRLLRERLKGLAAEPLEF
jgi:hypothetical protein